jgi:cell division protein FtsI (penicillin-binding protein 3)
VIDRIRRAVARQARRTDSVREAGTEWRITVKRRVAVAAVALAVWFGAIEARLLYLQVFAHADLVARAERQQRSERPLPAKRGDILDRHGRVLATSVDAESIIAVPSEIADATSAVKTLCTALGDCSRQDREALLERLGRPSQFAWVRRKVSPDQARRVESLDLDGVGLLKESRRFYPHRELAAHVLGYVGVDNDGLGGIEYAYGAEIRGEDGKVLVHTDARRHAFSRLERPPTAGSPVELTIDLHLQHIVERELGAAVKANRAAGGSAILMDPRTGEILALANEPTFNPNVYGDFSADVRRNRAVQDLYEPGSTFKIVTASAALEEEILPPHAPIDVSGGQIRIGRDIVEDQRDFGVLSLSDVIVNSSNVGAIRIGFSVGSERLSRYVERFGFGQPVSPDFPGENRGIVWDPARWTERALASVSMGYQVGVTPLQMVAAVASVANGGELLEPRVVGAFYRDERRITVKPKVLRRTVSADTAAVLTGIMEQVVARGTGQLAQIPGYRLAGKTGTAAKVVQGRYSRSEYNASFVGFAPSREPAIALIVVIDSPNVGTQRYFGGSVAAPVFKRIVEESLRYLGIAPDVNPSPPIVVAARRSELSPVATAGPDAPPRSTAVPQVNLIADEEPGAMPDLRGMSAREAARELARRGVVARLKGDGFVVMQEPVPGAPLDLGGVSVLTLRRRAPAGAVRIEP